VGLPGVLGFQHCEIREFLEKSCRPVRLVATGRPREADHDKTVAMNMPSTLPETVVALANAVV
jgi:hypothetical protein